MGRDPPPTSCAPALTILGMTIGVASVIILIAVGNGSSHAVKSQIQSPRHERAVGAVQRGLSRWPRAARPPAADRGLLTKADRPKRFRTQASRPTSRALSRRW